MTVQLKLEAGPLQVLFGTDGEKGTRFVEVIAARRAHDVGGQDTGPKMERFEFRGAEVVALAQLMELAAPVLRKLAGGSKR